MAVLPPVLPPSVHVSWGCVLYVHVYVVCISKERAADIEALPWAHSHAGPWCGAEARR